MDKKSMPEALKKVWERIKRSKYVLAVVLLGLFLILLPDKKENGTAQASETETVRFSVREEEKRIEAALSEIAGAGRVCVVLSVRSSEERVIAVDTEDYVLQEDGELRRETSQNTVTVSGDTGEEPVTVKTIYPEYRGALVVAEGADNAEIKLRLVQAVADLTGLSTEKITVVKMKSS